jgi:catechol 2,3-dioxygenase-like lactoylglutathione lyase family enzyme
MGVHHIALATADIEATHAFYTEAMGFELVKVVVGPTPQGGWAKHAFYDTGEGGMIAFWDLHVDALPEVKGGMSSAVGLPDWVNHLAFRAHDRAHLDAARDRWLSLGLDVFEVDHGFCVSIYTTDVNDTLVEWCLDTRELDEADREHAQRVILDAAPPWDDPPVNAVLHEADKSLRPAWAA